MQRSYPEPDDVGIRIPPHLKAAQFREGFRHALEGGQLDRPVYMRLSFRSGFRAAKLYLREVRRARGILEFPARWRFRTRAS